MPGRVCHRRPTCDVACGSCDIHSVPVGDQQLPLGLLAAPPYQGHSVELLPGDLLLVATDGILEAGDEGRSSSGPKSSKPLLLENRTQPLAVIAQKIHPALSASYIQKDDQSLLLDPLNFVMPQIRHSATSRDIPRKMN